MGITEILTIIFVVLKLLHKIDWNWFWVLFPEIVAGVIYIAMWIVTIIKTHRFAKEIDRGLYGEFRR